MLFGEDIDEAILALLARTARDFGILKSVRVNLKLWTAPVLAGADSASGSPSDSPPTLLLIPDRLRSRAMTVLSGLVPLAPGP
jgi:hypothetical protein